MQNVEQTILSQYANSPTLCALIQNMNQYIDPQADLDAFYDMVWNVETAKWFGLDIWGRIVNVSRMLRIPGAVTYFGFNEAYTKATAATGPQPWGQAPFYAGDLVTQTYQLADNAYRTLIYTKALSNISDCTAPSINQLLQNLFAGRGRCYVTDTGKMEMRLTFEFALLPFEIAILTQSGAIPRPAGVYVRVMQVDLATTFGFAEGSGQPFNQGVFFNPSQGFIDAN